MGEQVTSDTLRGATADPETLRQMTQAIMAQRPGLSYGEAQDMATAVYVGQRGQALKQQRQAAGEQFLRAGNAFESAATGFCGQSRSHGDTAADLDARQQSLGHRRSLIH